MRSVGKWKTAARYRLDISEPSIIKESSIRAMTSPVASPFKSSSPRVLNMLNWKFWLPQSAITWFSFASMSFSLMAEIQISYEGMNRSFYRAAHVFFFEHSLRYPLCISGEVPTWYCEEENCPIRYQTDVRWRWQYVPNGVVSSIYSPSSRATDKSRWSRLQRRDRSRSYRIFSSFFLLPMVFFNSSKASYSFRPLGSLRQRFWKSNRSLLIFSMSTSTQAMS